MAERQRRAPRSHQQSFRSTLPEFVSRDHTFNGPLIVYTCQRIGCGKGFAVPQERKLRGTAPCPHCFKVSRVP